MLVIISVLVAILVILGLLLKLSIITWQTIWGIIKVIAICIGVLFVLLGISGVIAYALLLFGLPIIILTCFSD